MLITVSQIKAQYTPPDSVVKKIYDDYEKEMVADYLKKHPQNIDLTEAKCDSIFLGLINQYRKDNGLKALKYVAVLDSACKLHTKWMIKNDLIGHTENKPSLDGKLYLTPADRIKKYDPAWNNAHPDTRENCTYVGSTGNSPLVKYKRINEETVKSIFDNWKTSPEHNAVMLMPNALFLGFYIESKYSSDKNNYIVMATMMASH